MNYYKMTIAKAITERNIAIAEKDAVIAEKDAVIAEKDAEIATFKEHLRRQ